MDTALMRAQASAPVREVILIWPSNNLPPHIRDMLIGLRDAYGIRVTAVKVRDSDVERMLRYIDLPDSEIPEMHRSFVDLLRRFGVRELPALVIDGRLVATGEDVENTLRRLLHTPAIA